MMDELDESKSGRVTYEHFRKWWKAFVASQKETPLHRFKIAARKISQEIAAVNILRGPLASPARTPRDNLEELSAPYSARRDSAMSRLYMYARGAYQPHRSTAMHSPRGIDVEPMVERTGTSKRAAPGTRVLMPFHAPLRGTATTSSQHPFVSFYNTSLSHLLTFSPTPSDSFEPPMTARSGVGSRPASVRSSPFINPSPWQPHATTFILPPLSSLCYRPPTSPALCGLLRVGTRVRTALPPPPT